jgi:hypothetical protein
VRVWVFPLTGQNKRSKKKYKKPESKSGYDDLMSLLSRDEDDDDDDELEGHRGLTEMESLAQLRSCKDKLDQFKGEDGRFDMFKLADETRSERPVYYIMTQEVFVDLLSEGVSESCFSTHANFGADLRKSTEPKVVAKMVFCNPNHDLPWESIQEKIKNRYVAKFARAL